MSLRGGLRCLASKSRRYLHLNVQRSASHLRLALRRKPQAQVSAGEQSPRKWTAFFNEPLSFNRRLLRYARNDMRCLVF